MSTSGFRDVLRVREFRWLWAADLQSLLGDQLARVALSVLVFQRTGSGFLTSGVYALTYLPALIGSVVLGPLADRMPRRRLLVVADLARAALFAAMALPGLPLGVVAALLVVAVTVGTPWKAAESALVAEILAGRGYALGTALRVASVQGSQLAGFALGGIAVAGVGARPALALDAITFAVSAVVIAVTVQARPAPGRSDARGLRAGVEAIAGNARLRGLLALSWLAGLLVVPEGLAAPYAARLGGGAATTGLLLAAGPTGTLVGSLVFARSISERARSRWVAPLAVLSGVPLMACALRPGLSITLGLWFLAGLCSAYQVQVVTEFVRAVANAVRGQAIAVASAGLLVVQGVGLILAGALEQVSGVGTAVAVAGLLASLIAVLLWPARRAQQTRHS